MAKLKGPIGPSHLSKVLDQVRSQPKLSLFGLRAIKLSYAFRNDHFGARHFAKEELPRIRYANPSLKVEVDKPIKTKDDHWKPEMELHLENGTTHTIDMHQKHSTTILQELLDLSGGDPWKKWKNTAIYKGLPLLPGSENVSTYTPPAPSSSPAYLIPPPLPGQLPNLTQFRAQAPDRAKLVARLTKEREERMRIAKDKEGKMQASLKSGSRSGKEQEQELDPETLENLKTKTGAAAILP